MSFPHCEHTTQSQPNKYVVKNLYTASALFFLVIPLTFHPDPPSGQKTSACTQKWLKSTWQWFFLVTDKVGRGDGECKRFFFGLFFHQLSVFQTAVKNFVVDIYGSQMVKPGLSNTPATQFPFGLKNIVRGGVTAWETWHSLNILMVIRERKHSNQMTPWCNL